MERVSKALFFILVLLFGNPVLAEPSFMVSPALGVANIANNDAYESSTFLRVDGSYFFTPQFGLDLFLMGYSDFETKTTGHDIALELNGYGLGVIGRWPLHERVWPYLRAEVLSWRAKAMLINENRKVGSDDGNSLGLAVGVQFPISRLIGLKTEFVRHNDISGADINHFAFGMTFSF